MDPETIDTIVHGAKVGGLVLGASAAVLTSYLASSLGLVRYFERKQVVEDLMPAYQNGHLTQKPTVLNIHKMTDPETAQQYRTSPHNIE